MATDVIAENSKLQGKPRIQVFARRWIILIIYIIYATLSSLQWVQYSIITNIVAKYYHVSASTVDWTSVIFCIVWPIFVFPASFIIDRMGLRVAGLIGAISTFIGTAIKIFSIGENLFGVVLFGQFIVAISQIFILSLPPKLAATWFKPAEASTVCSLGMFGLTLGTAIGFLAPPMIVQDSDNFDDLGYRFKIMCWGLALATAPAALVVIFYFPAKPPCPPSQAALHEYENKESVTFMVFLKSITTIMKNKAFVIHVFCYGLNAAVFCAIGTFLNQFILSYFSGAQEDAGRMGMVMIFSGMVGSILVGLILDKTHKYKETAFGVALLSAIGMGSLGLTLEMKSKWMVYLAIGIFGFFLNAYLPAGIEFGTELTFPSPQTTVASILFCSSQVLTFILTMVLGVIMEKFGTLVAILVMVGVLAVGTILTFLTPNILNRQAAFMKERAVEFTLIKK